MTNQPFYDPEVKAVLDAAPPFGTVTADNLVKIRANRLTMNEQTPLSDQVSRTDRMVAGPEGAADVRLRVHRRPPS